MGLFCMSFNVQPAIHRLTHEGSLVISVFSGPSTASPRVLFPTARYLQEKKQITCCIQFSVTLLCKLKIFQEKKKIHPLVPFTTAF